MADLLQFSSSVEIQAAADAGRPPRVSIMAYGGGVMNVPGFGPVALDLAGIEASGPVTLLVDHNANLDGIAGSGTATKRDGKLYVDGTLVAASEAGRKVIELARGGVALQASVGVMPTEREHIRGGDSFTANGRTIKAAGAGVLLIRRGTLREVSITALGADGGTSVTVAAKTSHKGTPIMAQNATETTFDPETGMPLEAWNVPDMAPSERVLARFQSVKFTHPDIRGRAERAMHAALAGKVSFEGFERDLLQAHADDLQVQLLHAERPKLPLIRAAGGSGGADERSVIEAALLCHLGGEAVAAKTLGDAPTQRARDMRCTSMVEILQAAWRAVGADMPLGRDQMIKASFSSGAIANIVSNVQNKLLLDQWARLPLMSRLLAKKLSASDFKETKAIRLAGRNVAFEELGEGGEIKHGSLSDSAAPFKLGTYARMYGLTRVQIINDDLSALAEMPKIVARGAGLKQESLFWTLVLANTNSFFHTDNGNALTAVLGLDGLGAGVSLMRKLVDEDGEPLLCEPKYLVVPPELETTATSLYISASVVAAGGETLTLGPNASVFAGKYQPQISPYLSNTGYAGSSTTQWYLFADPSSVPAFGVATLNNQETPIVEQEDAPFNQLGVQYRGYFDVGVCQIDHQGAVKSAGTG